MVRTRLLRMLVPRPLSATLAASAMLTLASPALALQPVEQFLTHARTWNPTNRAAHATVEQRDAEMGVQTGNLLPNFTGSATYTLNQHEITFPIPGAPTPLILQPLNQADGFVMLTVPIINIANWDRRDAAKSTLEGAHADEENSAITVEKTVLRDYYQLLGYESVLLSAQRNLEVAVHNVKLARDRKENGTSSELDVQRGLADQARAEQAVTAAQLNVVNTRRDLASQSGLEPDPAAAGFPEDDLHEEQALSTWTGEAEHTPAVASAVAATRAANDAAHAARTGWLPTVQAIGEEKFTNATLLVGGHSAIAVFQLNALWKLDLTVMPQIRAQNAAYAAARANEDRIRTAAQDAVYRDWQQIHADIDSARAARVQVASTKLAASLAEDRYASGVATQLDVLQARQDAFAADVARIQADADLAYARLALRLDAGRLTAAKDVR
jgi:outer membrane protein TolC